MNTTYRHQIKTHVSLIIFKYLKTTAAFASLSKNKIIKNKHKQKQSQKHNVCTKTNLSFLNKKSISKIIKKLKWNQQPAVLKRNR